MPFKRQSIRSIRDKDNMVEVGSKQTLPISMRNFLFHEFL